MEAAVLQGAIARGLGFLSRSQLPSGEFQVLMATDHSLPEGSAVDSSVFPTALIAYSLGFASADEACAMIEKSLRFFLAQMEGPGLWRYWTKQHRYHSVIPPDLDDIACVSCVLRRHGVDFPDNLPLVLANRNPRGLFYTWLTPRWPMPRLAAYWRAVVPQWLHPFRHYAFWKLNESKPSDVDCVVNANVLLYVGDRAESGAVVEYLIDAFRRGEEGCCDKWHLNPYMFQYCVSRNFHAGLGALGAIREESVARLVRATRADGACGESVLDTALAACALLNWGESPPELARAMRYLLQAQRADGAWPRAVLYYGGPKKYYGWGSDELSTGFCLEALLRYHGRSDSTAAQWQDT